MPLVDPADVRAVVAYEGATTQAVQTIMKFVVAEKSEEKYTNKITPFCCGFMLMICCVRSYYKIN
eukprot:2387978-Ditylum_brightwellii.AAC.1